jgi:hypothetical protein
MRSEATSPRPEARRAGDDLFSIDVDSLIGKVAARTFRSPHHYPVVRAALGRGAGHVRVSVDRTSLAVRDDGEGVPEDSLAGLVRVFDRSLAPAARQAALASLEDGGGAGLLAALAPSPSRLEIDTAGGGGRGWTVTVEGGQARRRPASRPIEGTRVRLVRRGDPRAERRALSEWCAFARASVVVDGEQVGGHGPPPDAIARREVNRGGRRRGVVWIPARGDACRVEVLEAGIRRSELVGPPEEGLVFEAALEIDEGGVSAARSDLIETARGLYEDLPRLHRHAPPSVRPRIEQLLFLHHRRTHETRLLDAVAPFATLGPGPGMGLSEVRRRVREGDVRAIEVGDDPRRYQTRGIVVLALTPAQREFLTAHAGVDVGPPPPAPSRPSWTRRLGRRLTSWWKRLAGGMHAALVDVAGPQDVDPAHRALESALRDALAAGRVELPPGAAGGPPRVVMSRNGTSRPGRLLEIAGRWTIVVHLRHPLLPRACRALERDPRNLAVIVAWLTAGQAAMDERDQSSS